MYADISLLTIQSDFSASIIIVDKLHSPSMVLHVYQTTRRYTHKSIIFSLRSDLQVYFESRWLKF